MQGHMDASTRPSERFTREPLIFFLLPTLCYLTLCSRYPLPGCPGAPEEPKKHGEGVQTSASITCPLRHPGRLACSRNHEDIANGAGLAWTE